MIYCGSGIVEVERTGNFPPVFTFVLGHFSVPFYYTLCLKKLPPLNSL